MGAIGSAAPVYKEVPVKGLIFGTAVIRKDYIDVDGYVNRKSEEAMLNQFAKAIEPLDKGEADNLRMMARDAKTFGLDQVHPDKSIGGAQYILEWEEVPSASQWNDEKDEMEYKDAKWYVHIRFVR